MNNSINQFKKDAKKTSKRILNPFADMKKRGVCKITLNKKISHIGKMENKYKDNVNTYFSTTCDNGLKKQVQKLAAIHGFNLSKTLNEYFEHIISKYENKEVLS